MNKKFEVMKYLTKVYSYVFNNEDISLDKKEKIRKYIINISNELFGQWGGMVLLTWLILED